MMHSAAIELDRFSGRETQFPGSVFAAPDDTGEIVRRYHQAYDVLRRSEDLSPNNPAINYVLSRLVAALSQPVGPAGQARILGNPLIQARMDQMLAMLSWAESAMEFHYSALIDNRTRGDFPYLQNYLDLVAAELAEIKLPRLRPGQSVAFVGAGPLPLSAIVLHEMTRLAVTCIDCDGKAAAAGAALLARFGLDRAIRYVHCDGAAYDYQPHPLVFVASLIEPKQHVIAAIRRRTGQTMLGVRSAEGVHQLLYRPVDCERLERLGVRFDRCTSATPSIINTTLFATLQSDG